MSDTAATDVTAPCVRPETAMVLAAGLGTRMRPLTDTRPKPLVSLAGRALIDHVLDRIADAGIGHAIVNVHYRADQIEAHIQNRQRPCIVVSDERDALLDTGGGVKRALTKLGAAPFLVHNSDSVWIEHGQPVIETMLAAWRPDVMDVLLLLADPRRTLGYDGRGDFNLADAGHVSRRGTAERADHVFAGVSIMTPRLLDGMPDGAFSLNRAWDVAIARNRAQGVLLDGLWMHVGTPEALREAERAIATGPEAQTKAGPAS